MNILLVIPTHFEAKYILPQVFSDRDDFLLSADYCGHKIQALVCGAGPVACAAATASALAAKQFDMAINLGIAGSYILDIEPGSIVCVTDECFPEFGIQPPDSDEFVPIHSMDFHCSLPDFYVKGKIINPYISQFKIFNQWIFASGATVIGLNYSRNFHNQTGAEIETMEGASFFYACSAANVPFIQLRGISNYTGIPGQESWIAKEALSKLSGALKDFLENLKYPAV